MVAEKIGVNLPLKVIKHNYLVTDIIPGMSKFPNVRYSDGSVYLKVRPNYFCGQKLEISYIFQSKHKSSLD